MTDTTKKAGKIAWVDLTVPHAASLSDFYRNVVGWTRSDFDMGEYQDYCMNSPEDGETVVGICHSRGANADLPPQWLIYFNVEDLDRAIEACTAGGGEIVASPRGMGSGRFAVIRDPEGAVCALLQS